jgi:hypothetical protein
MVDHDGGEVVTVAEFKELVASLPSDTSDYWMSPYTDIAGIVGFYIDDEDRTVWLSDHHDGIKREKSSL